MSFELRTDEDGGLHLHRTVCGWSEPGGKATLTYRPTRVEHTNRPCRHCAQPLADKAAGQTPSSGHGCEPRS